MKITLSADALYDLASAGALASTDKARPILTAVKLEISGTTAKAVATDSYRLVTIERDIIDSDSETGAALIPADILAKAAKDAAKTGDDCTITVDDNLTFSIANSREEWRYGGRLIDGNYPDVISLIPKAGTLCEIDGNIAFNAFYLADFTKVAPWSGLKGRAKTGNDGGIKITAINDSRRPIRFESYDGRTIIVIMPIVWR